MEKINGVTTKGGVCLLNENLREVIVYFKTRGDVSVILINLRGGGSNYPFILLLLLLLLLLFK